MPVFEIYGGKTPELTPVGEIEGRQAFSDPAGRIISIEPSTGFMYQYQPIPDPFNEGGVTNGWDSFRITTRDIDYNTGTDEMRTLPGWESVAPGYNNRLQESTDSLNAALDAKGGLFGNSILGNWAGGAMEFAPAAAAFIGAGGLANLAMTGSALTAAPAVGGGTIAGGGGAAELVGGAAADTLGAGATGGMSGDAISGIDHLLRTTGAGTATEGAAMLGFPSTEAYLASINPAWLSAAGAAAAAGGAAASGPAWTGAASGAGGVGTAASAGSALSRILDGTANADDYLSTLGKAVPGLIGAYASNQQADAIRDVADREDARLREMMNFGAPSRQRYEASFDPGFDLFKTGGYDTALDTSTRSLANALSVQGNPYGNPTAQAEIHKNTVGNLVIPALQNYRTQNANTGGYSSFNTSAASGGDSTKLNLAGVGADANVWNALGGAAADVFTPKRSLEDVLKGLRL